MEELDLTGLACPMPVIKIKKFLAENKGRSIVFTVRVYDRGALKDIPAFCQQQRIDCQLIEEGDEIVFQLNRLKEGV